MATTADIRNGAVILHKSKRMKVIEFQHVKPGKGGAFVRTKLKDIQSGKFTKQWMDEHKSGQKNFLKMRQDLAKHPIEKVGKELRAMMPWIGKNKLVDKDKN